MRHSFVTFVAFASCVGVLASTTAVAQTGPRATPPPMPSAAAPPRTPTVSGPSIQPPAFVAPLADTFVMAAAQRREACYRSVPSGAGYWQKMATCQKAFLDEIKARGDLLPEVTTFTLASVEPAPNVPGQAARPIERAAESAQPITSVVAGQRIVIHGRNFRYGKVDTTVRFYRDDERMDRAFAPAYEHATRGTIPFLHIRQLEDLATVVAVERVTDTAIHLRVPRDAVAGYYEVATIIGSSFERAVSRVLHVTYPPVTPPPQVQSPGTVAQGCIARFKITGMRGHRHGSYRGDLRWEPIPYTPSGRNIPIGRWVYDPAAPREPFGTPPPADHRDEVELSYAVPREARAGTKVTLTFTLKQSKAGPEGNALFESRIGSSFLVGPAATCPPAPQR